MKSTDITGNDCSKKSGYLLNPKRLIIIEMLETEEQKRIREENEIKMIERIFNESYIISLYYLSTPFF